MNGENIDEIVRAVAAEFHLDPELVLSKDRHKTVSEARAVVSWILRKTTRLSYTQIGWRTKRKDHTVAVHNVRSVERLRQNDPWFLEVTDRLLERFASGEQTRRTA